MQETGAHNIILEGRKKLSVLGVLDVGNFNENCVSAVTNMGALVIKGQELHINKLDTKTYELEVLGKVDSVCYTQIKQKGGSAFKKLFK